MRTLAKVALFCLLYSANNARLGATTTPEDTMEREMVALAKLAMRDRLTDPGTKFVNLVSFQRKRRYSSYFAAVDSEIDLVFRVSSGKSLMLCNASVIVPDRQGPIRLHKWKCQRIEFNDNGETTTSMSTALYTYAETDAQTKSQPFASNISFSTASSHSKDYVSLTANTMIRQYTSSELQDRSSFVDLDEVYDVFGVFQCPIGTEFTGGRCFSCGINNFYNSERGTCDPCPDGYVTAWSHATFCITKAEAEGRNWI